MPCAFVVIVVVTSVAIFLRETFALGMAAAEMSVTLPEMVPPTTCPCRGLEKRTLSSSARTAAKQTADFIKLIPDAIGHLLKACQLDNRIEFFRRFNPGSADIGPVVSLRSQSIDQKIRRANKKMNLFHISTTLRRLHTSRHDMTVESISSSRRFFGSTPNLRTTKICTMRSPMRKPRTPLTS